MASLDRPKYVVDCKKYTDALEEARKQSVRDYEREAELRLFLNRCQEHYMEMRRKQKAERERKEKERQDQEAVAAGTRRPDKGYQGSKYPAMMDFLREEEEREAAENMTTPSEDGDEGEEEGEGEGEGEDDAMSASDEDDVFPDNSHRYARQVAIDEAIRELMFVRRGVEAMTTSANVRANAAQAMITYLKDPNNRKGVDPSIVRDILERVGAYENAARAHVETMASVEDHAKAATEAVRAGYKQFETWATSMSHLTASANRELNEILDQYRGEPYDSDGSDASNA